MIAFDPTRLRRGACLALVIVLGLLSRAGSIRPHLPALVGEYAGDTLWAAAVFFAAGLVFSKARLRSLLSGSAAFAFLVELSQLAHPPWLDAIRAWPGAGLFLGYDFVVSDLVCYGVGLLSAAGLERWAADRVRRGT